MLFPKPLHREALQLLLPRKKDIAVSPQQITEITETIKSAIVQEPKKPPQKSLFSSLTFWSAIISCWLAISPEVEGMLERGFSAKRAISILNQSLATTLIIFGRYNASTLIYTPKNLPGRDKV